MAGRNLHVETSNFQFAPENAGLAPAPGEAAVSVTLNANDLRALAVGQNPLRAQSIVSVR